MKAISLDGKKYDWNIYFPVAIMEIAYGSLFKYVSPFSDWLHYP